MLTEDVGEFRNPHRRQVRSDQGARRRDPLRLSRAFAPILKRNGGGAIVNVLSVLSWLSTPVLATYPADREPPPACATASDTAFLPASPLDFGVRNPG